MIVLQQHVKGIAHRAKYQQNRWEELKYLKIECNKHKIY